MWVYDRRTQRFLEVNSAAVLRYGYSRDEFLSMTVADIRPAEERERLTQALQSSSSALLREMGMRRYRTKSGAEILVDVVSTAAHFAGRQAHAVIALDVTEQHRRETERLEAEHVREAALLERTRLLEIAADAADQQHRFLRDVLYSVTEGKLRLCNLPTDLPSPLPAAPDGSGQHIALDAAALSQLRHQVDVAAAGAGLPTARRGDLLMAVGEAAMNAVVHGGGGVGHVRADPTQGTVQVWIEDAGAGIDLQELPRATLERGYSSGGSLGFGFGMMLRTCDRIWLLTGPAGTTIVLEQEKDEPDFDLL
jgi:PAS domain S-box-containing protein